MNIAVPRAWPALNAVAPNGHTSVLLICTAAIAFGLIAILVSAWTHHRSRPQTATPLSVELGWALVPCLMVLGLVWTVVKAAVVAA